MACKIRITVLHDEGISPELIAHLFECSAKDAGIPDLLEIEKVVVVQDNYTVVEALVHYEEEVEKVMDVILDNACYWAGIDETKAYVCNV